MSKEDKKKIVLEHFLKPIQLLNLFRQEANLTKKELFIYFSELTKVFF